MTHNVVATTNQALDPNLLLGHLLFLVVDDLKVHKNDLAALFKKHQLSQSFLPNEIKPHDAYRRASSRAAQTIDIVDNNSVYKAKLLVREVKKDDKRIVRHLIRELIDEKNEETRYVPVGKMVFDRNNDAMNIEWDPGYLTEYDYKQVLEDTRNLYLEWTQYHTKDTVRNIFTKVVKAMQPVTVTAGGRAQFVPKINTDLLLSLKAVTEELPGYSVAEVIPIVDTVDIRNMISKNLNREVAYEVDKLLEDFSELLKSGQPLRSTTVKRYAGLVVEMQDKTKEYEGLLNAKMNMLNMQLMAALKKVESAPVADGVTT